MDELIFALIDFHTRCCQIKEHSGSQSIDLNARDQNFYLLS